MNKDKLTFREGWNTLKTSWQILIIIFTFFISLGIVQINLFTIEIPPEWHVPFVMGMTLIAFAVALAVSFLKISKLESSLSNSQTKISKLESNAPMLFIEDVPIQGLGAHVSKRAGKAKNQVHLDLLEVSVDIQGSGVKQDAAMRWRLLGTNSTDSILANLHLSIAGETLIPLIDLECAIYNLSKDPKREHKLLPILIGEDSTNKNLLLPFRSPGIQPYEHFNIEFSYTWPAIVNVRKDYWFIDPTNYAASVDKLKFEVSCGTSLLKTAYVFRLDIVNNIAEFQGSLPIESIASKLKITFEVENPKPEMFYVLIMEGSEK